MDLPPPVPADVPLIVVGLTKHYGDKVALDRLTFHVPAGACYGLVGPNGSGKSTTMRSVVGLVRPDAGEIVVCGARVADDVIGARRSMGVMLDPLQLFDRLSAWEYLETIGQLRLLDGSHMPSDGAQAGAGGHLRRVHVCVVAIAWRMPSVVFGFRS